MNGNDTTTGIMVKYEYQREYAYRRVLTTVCLCPGSCHLLKRRSIQENQNGKIYEIFYQVLQYRHFLRAQVSESDSIFRNISPQHPRRSCPGCASQPPRWRIGRPQCCPGCLQPAAGTTTAHIILPASHTKVMPPPRWRPRFPTLGEPEAVTFPYIEGGEGHDQQRAGARTERCRRKHPTANADA